MKIRKRMLSFSLAIVTALSMTSIASARNIATLVNFQVSPYGWVNTPYLNKVANNRAYVLNTQKTAATDKKVRHFLVNSGNQARSAQYVTPLKSTYIFGNNGQSGYIYAIRMKGENWQSSTIYGSWSPDQL